MSTLTSLVKSGKVKIVKTKTEQPERKRKSIKARQEPDKSTGSSAANRGFLGRPMKEYRGVFLVDPMKEYRRMLPELNRVPGL